MWTLEENLTYAGQMMLDLRGNWAYEYKERMEYVIDVLESALVQAKEIKPGLVESIKQDIDLTKEELNDGCWDGRIFRDSSNFYGYSSDEGSTYRIKKELYEDATYPESIVILEGLENENL